MSIKNSSKSRDYIIMIFCFILLILVFIVCFILSRFEYIEPEYFETETTTSCLETTASTNTDTTTTYESTLTTYKTTTSDTSCTTYTDLTVTSTNTFCESTTAATTVLDTTTFPIVATTYITTITEKLTTPSNSSDHGVLIGTFNGTYFCYEKTDVKGGSGRNLIDCSIGDTEVKGSIACRYIFDKYCYNHNGRTKVYLIVPDFPDMTGHYYLDDCNSSYCIVDFFYYYRNNCPFKDQGVIKNIELYFEE